PHPKFSVSEFIVPQGCVTSAEPLMGVFPQSVDIKAISENKQPRMSKQLIHRVYFAPEFVFALIHPLDEARASLRRDIVQHDTALGALLHVIVDMSVH